MADYHTYLRRPVHLLIHSIPYTFPVSLPVIFLASFWSSSFPFLSTSILSIFLIVYSFSLLITRSCNFLLSFRHLFRRLRHSHSPSDVFVPDLVFACYSTSTIESSSRSPQAVFIINLLLCRTSLSALVTGIFLSYNIYPSLCNNCVLHTEHACTFLAPCHNSDSVKMG